MKLVYKLKDNFYNVSQIKKVSNIRIRNRFEEEEQRKREDEKRDRNSSNIFANCKFLDPRVSVPHFYSSYTSDCKTIEITIDGEVIQCDNFKFCSEEGYNLGLFSFMSGEYRTTQEKIDEFNEFRIEARELLTAFTKLNEEDIPEKSSKEWIHEKCGTNTPPNFVPNTPPAKTRRELLDELTAESQKLGLYDVHLVTLDEVLRHLNKEDEEDE